MKQEDKDLLLRDLCTRLPYGVLFMVHDEINEFVELLSINPKRDNPLEIDDGYDENSSTYWNLEDAKPYLRLMSSMTKAEEKEYKRLCVNAAICNDYQQVDYLNSHHFDYRGLIEKGLALEAPEGMYKL